MTKKISVERGIFTNFFDAKGLGRTMVEVEAHLIRTENNIEVLSRWFHSQRDLDFYIWTDKKNNVIKQQMNISGLIIEWNIVDGSKTGMIVEEEEIQKNQLIQKVHYDKTPQSSVIHQASELILHIAGLSESDKQVLVDNLKLSPTLTSLGLQEILHRYGPDFSHFFPVRMWIGFVKRIKGLWDYLFRRH